MSWEEENMDELFREAAQSQSVEFKEEFWDEFERTLPQKKRNRFPFIWFSVAALVLFGIGAMYLLETKDSGGTKRVAKSDVPKNEPPKEASSDVKSKPEDIYFSTDAGLADQQSSIKKALQKGNIENNLAQSQPTLIANPVSIAIPEESTNVLYSEDGEAQLSMKSFRFEKTELGLMVNTFGMPIYKKWRFYGELGVLAGQSPMTNDTQSSDWMTGVSLGFGWVRSYGKFQFSMGMALANRRYENLEINRRVKIYDFGSKIYDQQLMYKNLVLVDLPIYVGYKNQKHTIQLGVTTSVLTTTRTKYQLQMNQQTVEKDIVYGYDSGLRRVMVQPSLRYDYQLTPLLSLGTSISYQATGMLSQAVFTGTENGHPISGQVFIRKILN